MHNAIPLIVAALIAVGIIVIGCFYLASPQRILGTFGLKPPANDADTLAWLRPKGIRDVVAGLVVLTMMLTADTRLVGIALLVEAVIPFGDMSIILGSGGVEVASVLRSWRNLRGDACRRPLVDPCHLRHAPPPSDASAASASRVVFRSCVTATVPELVVLTGEGA